MRRIVIHLRSCPLRLLGPYGCEWTETPTLDRLAVDGVVFDGHFAIRPGQDLSSPSYATWVDGFDSDVIPFYLQDLLAEENGLLLLQIDEFVFPGNDFQKGSINLAIETDRELIFEQSEKVISQLDALIALYVKKLTDAGLDQNTLLLFTATSGLPLGEHGIIGTADSRLHEELVQLPLIVRFPDGRLAGHRVAGFTTPEDLRELLTTGHTEQLEALIRGERPTRESITSLLGDPPKEIALRTADSCLILPQGDNDRPALLFERPDDRFEVNDLYTRQPDRAEELKSKIQLTTESQSTQR